MNTVLFKSSLKAMSLSLRVMLLSALMLTITVGVLGTKSASAASLCLDGRGTFASCPTTPAPAPHPAPKAHRPLVSPKSRTVTKTPLLGRTIQVTSTGIAPVRTVALAGVAILTALVLGVEGFVLLQFARRRRRTVSPFSYR